MRAFRSTLRTGTRHGLAWLLWLALLLPLAQTVALRHGVSHLAASGAAGSSLLAAAQPAAAEGDAPAGPAHAAHCELCLTAAAGGVGAPPPAQAALLVSALRHALPALALAPGVAARTHTAYRSRAPPTFSSH